MTELISITPTPAGLDHASVSDAQASAHRTGLWLERIVLGCLVAMLFLDRVRLCIDILFRYTEEDQAVQWFGAREILRGTVHEPCYYGQAYNSCLEGYLAAPLVALRVPYHIACPLVAVLLGLLPFAVLSLLAWQRRQFFASAFAIFLPTVMPLRYGIVTGLPRGFVTGLAAGALAAWLLLRQRDTSENGSSEAPADTPLTLWRGWREARDDFFFGVLMVLAWALNPNSAVVLLPLGVFAVCLRFWRWRFWVAAPLGAAFGGLYPLLCYQFYYVWHDDYRFHYRDQTLHWAIDNFAKFLPHLDSAFGDFLPFQWHPAQVLLGIFLLLIVLLIVRRRFAGAAAGLSGMALVVVSFFCQRVQVSAEHVYLSYSRMFLGVPVLLAMLIVWLELSHSKTPRSKWIYRMSLIALVIAASLSMRMKNGQFEDQAAYEMRPFASFAITPMDEIKRVARNVQIALDATKTSFVLIPNWEQRPYNYVIPCMTTGDSLFPGYERRTWRLYEECLPRYDQILVFGSFVPVERLRAVDADVRRVGENPDLWLLNTRGRSVIRIARLLKLQIRPFEIPANTDAKSD